MNRLEGYLKFAGIDEVAAMNALQDVAVISDNCIWAKDAADCDCDKAIEFLTINANGLHSR